MAKIHQLSGRIFSRLLKKAEITEINPAQGRIMFVLWQNDGISIGNLAQRTSLSKSTLTSMLDRLENSGFIQRRHSKTDRREILIFRTEKDKSLQAVYVQVSEEMTDKYYADFSQEEIVTFEEFLKRIYRNLKGLESGADE